MSGWDFVTLGFGFGKLWSYLVPDCAARSVSQLLRICAAVRMRRQGRHGDILLKWEMVSWKVITVRGRDSVQNELHHRNTYSIYKNPNRKLSRSERSENVLQSVDAQPVL
jgi:hypothetical protein